MDLHNFSPQPTKTTWARKLKLLMWKNFKVQSRNKIQTIVEIFIPIIFTLALAYLRIVIPAEKISEPTLFKPFPVSRIPPVLKTTNKIFYAPNSASWDAVMAFVKEQYFTSRRLKYSFLGFPTESELIQAYRDSNEVSKPSLTDSGKGSSDTPSSILAGVVFPNLGPGNVSKIGYKLRFPAYQRNEFDILPQKLSAKSSWYTEVPFPLFSQGSRSAESTGGFPGYFAEGFLYLQNAIESSIIKTFLNETQGQELEGYNVTMQRFPYPSCTKDGFTFVLQFWLSYFLVLSFVYPAMNVTKMIVHEKESRMKEYMKIMGLPNWLHWTAWFLKAFTLYGISMIIITILVKVKFSEGRAILTETDGSVVLAVLLCHVVTLVGFCFFLSTLFSTANSAATTAGFLWIIVYIPFSFALTNMNVLTRLSKYLTCFLLGNLPLSHACYIFAMFESSGTGVHWSNIAEGVTPADSFSILDCMIMMLVNSAVFMIAGFYIELIWPGKYGVPLPWYFPFTKWYWIDGVQVQGIAIDNFELITQPKTEYFETEHELLRSEVGVNVRGLTKSFGKKIAVQKTDCRFYENQVTVLLGQNGAGKTTLMSMLTGLITPTSGTASVNGYDIWKDMRAVRRSIGICPQHNVLFDDLTVEEHIRFFSLLKGCSIKGANKEVERLVLALNFEKKRHAQAHTLSGGMKRKLSVGIAFCGGSKIVLLDEPTSGMDHANRKFTSELVRREKLGRTIVLSTHSMEESDLLGDRIAIIADGAVKCIGRPIFLKKMYGRGYRLTILQQANCSASKITDFLRTKCSAIQINDRKVSELCYSVPETDSPNFPILFEELEAQKDNLGIAGFSFGSISMEEVFMRVAEENQLDKEIFCQNSSVKPNSNQNNVRSTEIPVKASIPDEKLLNDVPKNNGIKLIWQQLRGIIGKKILYLLRNRQLAVLQIIIPLGIVCGGMLSVKTVPGIGTPAPLHLSLHNYEKVGRTITPTKCKDGDKICDGYRIFISEKFKVEDVQGEDLQHFYLNKATENVRLAESTYMIGMEQANRTLNGEDTELIAFFNNQPFHTPPLALNYLSNGILRAFGIQVELSVTNHPFDYTHVDSVKQTGKLTLGFVSGWTIQFALGIMGAALIISLVSERAGAKHLQFVAGLRCSVYWIGSAMVDIANYMFPCLLILLILVILDFDQFKTCTVMVNFLVLCLAHGWCMVGMMSLFSFAFTIPSSGFARMTLLNSGLGLITIILVAALESPEYEFLDLAATLHQVFLLVPNYALGMGVIQICRNYDMGLFCGQLDIQALCRLDGDLICCTEYKDSYYAWEALGTGKNIFSLCVTGVLCFLGVFLIESGFIARIRSKFKLRHKPGSPDLDANSLLPRDCYDEDVAKEAERIQGQSVPELSKTENLILRNLTKTYKNKLRSVNHLLLGIGKGEIFGLLGHNGAGKTTAFKMITGVIPIMSGDAFVCNHSVRKDLWKVFKNLGYCPQFDALIDQLTGREILRLFANLRGIRETHIDKVIENLTENLLLAPHIDKKVGEYSGGNKRKLSTALALLGNPPVVFLDEPTTGMDPIACWQVWSAIKCLREMGTSVVLSSHSMEECEALCTRLAVMVNGRLKCLGSPQHLKTKFGKGYIVKIQSGYCCGKEESSVERSQELTSWEVQLQKLKRLFAVNFPDSILQDTHPGIIEYYFPMCANVKWGEIFAVMGRAKEELQLEAYHIYQTVCLFLASQFQQKWRRRAPGPWGLPILGHLHLLGTTPGKTLLEWRKVYGPIVSIKFGNQPAVAISDGELIREAFSQARFSGRPSLKFFSTVGTKGMVRGDDAGAFEQRKFFHSSLNRKTTRDTMDARIVTEVAPLLATIGSKEGKPVAMSSFFQIYIFNVMWGILMSGNECHDNPEMLKMLENLSRAQSLPGTFEVLAMFNSWLASFASRKRTKSLVDSFDFLSKRYQQHKLSRVPGNPRDVTDLFLDKLESPSRNNEMRPDVEEYFIGSSFEAFVAGYDTTSASLEWMLLYLTKFPDVRRKFQEEIDKKIGSGRKPTLNDEPNMPFVQAVINESLRMTAIGPLGFFHRAIEDSEFKGFFIPKDTMIVSNLYAVQHDPVTWGDPETFRPERFLDSDGNFTQRSDVMAFGTGRRSCIAERLARNHLFLFSVSIFQLFETHFYGDEPPMGGVHGIVVKPQPFQLTFTKR